MCQPTKESIMKKNSSTTTNNNKTYESETSLRYPHSTHPIVMEEDLPTLDPSHVPYRVAAKYILSELEKMDMCPPTVGIM